VKSAGFTHLFVRKGPRYLNHIKYDNVIDIANIRADTPGKGTFSELSDELHLRGYNLYIQSVLNERFATKLLRMGYTQVADREPPSFYLLAK
jgi:hypothetical protein